MRSPRKLGDGPARPRVRLSLQSLEDRVVLSSTTATLATIGLPSAATSLTNAWAEKNYEWHSTLTTYTFGNTTYKIGAVEEATYEGTGDTPGNGDGNFVTGSGWSEYSFVKIVDGQTIDQSDPSKNSWTWDSASDFPPPSSLGSGSTGQGNDGTMPPPPSGSGSGSGSGSSTGSNYGSGSGMSAGAGSGMGAGAASGSGSSGGTTPGVVTGGGMFPFLVPSLGAGQFWTQVSTTENSVRLANGVFNDESMGYAYTVENRENTTNTLTQGAAVVNSASTTVSITSSGDYFNQFTSRNWEDHYRQDSFIADNMASGTFSHSENLTGHYDAGVEVSRDYNESTRLNGTYSNISNRRSYSDNVIDALNSTLGETTRDINNNGILVTIDDTNLFFVPNDDSTGWKVESGTISEMTEDKMTVVNDQTTSRVNFKVKNAFLEQSGYAATNSVATDGQLNIKSTRDGEFVGGIATVDKIKQEYSYNRNKSSNIHGTRKYKEETLDVLFGSTKNGDEISDVSLAGRYEDQSEHTQDFVANTIVDVQDQFHYGTHSKMLKDQGASVGILEMKTAYDTFLGTGGPFLLTGNIRTETNVKPAASMAIFGVAAAPSSTTIKVNLYSHTEWGGIIRSDQTFSAPNQFTVVTKKKSYPDEDDYLNTTDLISVDGTPKSGSVYSKQIRLGVDEIEITSSGSIKSYSEPVAGQPRQLRNTHTVDTVAKWWGHTTAGRDETTITFNGGVKTIENEQDYATNGGNSLTGYYIVDQFLPTKSDTRTDYLPTLPALIRPKSGTFDNTRNQKSKTVSGVLVSGDFLKTHKSTEGLDVKVKNTNDLTIPNLVVGTETKISTTVKAGSIDQTFDRQVVDGKWNDERERFDNSSTRGTKDSSNNRTTTTDYLGNSGTKVGSQTSIIDDKLIFNTTRITNKGQRGRGFETNKENVEVKLKETKSSRQFGNFSENGSSRTNSNTTTATVDNHATHDYDRIGEDRKLLSFDINIKKSSNSNSNAENTSPNGVWNNSKTSSTTKFELLRYGTPVNWSGTLIDYNNARMLYQSNENPTWTTLSDSTTGSWTVPTVINNWPSAWDGTWAQASWDALGETWVGSAASWTWSNGQDLLRILAGGIDVGVGIAMGTTGVGGIPGVALMFVGIDQILTGSMNMRYGRVGKNLSVIENAVFQATGNETLAVLTPGVLSLGLGWYGSLARAAAREAAGMAMPAFAFEQGLYGGALMRGGVETMTAAEIAAAGASVSWWTVLWLRLGFDLRVPAFASSGVSGFLAADVPLSLLQRIANISVVTGRESGLLLRTDGMFVIRLGRNADSVSSASAKWFFAHTHLNGNLTLSFRSELAACDVAVMSSLRQPWTIIVGPRGDAVVWASWNKNYWGDGVGLVWEILRGMR